MSLDSELAKRVDRLVAKGEEVKRTHTPNPPNVAGFTTLDSSSFAEWQTQGLNFLTNVLGSEHVYTEHFRCQVKDGYNSHVETGQGILRAFKDDLQNGYLTEVRNLISAELFSSFLEMAEHLHEAGYKDPAASLAGAVLEDGLRKIATANGVKLKAREDLNSLNRKIADKGVYNRLVQKKIQVWTDVRNHADHGAFDEYSSDDVSDVIRGVERFLSNYLQ